MTIHFETLGCRLNQDETEGAARSFLAEGFSTDLESVTAKTEENGDVVLSVINTCTVTTKAEQKARRIIRLLLEKFPNAPVLVTGCYAELDGPEIQEIHKKRIVILPGSKKFLLSLIPSFIKEYNPDAEGFRKFITENIPAPKLNVNKLTPVSRFDSFTLYTPVFEKHSRSSIKIQDGCNNSCTFCRIHLARGKSVSLEPEEILNRVKELEKQNAGEIVFTGVNLSQYAGFTKEKRIMSFKDLLEFLLENTEKVKFRISSFYPQHITEELCSVLTHERVQPFFHLSIQSGSDKILAKMKRPYKVEHVTRAVELLRKAKDNPFISCDIIAGFPTETEEDFEETKKLCNELKFAWIHSFPYSVRPGTEAALMKPQIPERIKDERASWLTKKAKADKADYVRQCVGKEFNAVVENSRALRLGTEASKIQHGVTDNFLHVQFESHKAVAPGSVVRIKISDVLLENIESGKEIECTGVLV